MLAYIISIISIEKTKLDEISTLTDNFSKRTNVVLKIKIINKQIITPSCKH